MEMMARNYFNSDISLVLIEEVLKLGHIVKHKSIFTKLNFDQDFFFDEINLFKRTLDFRAAVWDLDGVYVF